MGLYPSLIQNPILCLSIRIQLCSIPKGIYGDVKAGVPNAMEKYKGLLKSGGSDFPVNQAKLAGADLTKKETFEAVVYRFNQLIDLLEAILEN